MRYYIFILVSVFNQFYCVPLYTKDFCLHKCATKLFCLNYFVSFTYKYVFVLFFLLNFKSGCFLVSYNHCVYLDNTGVNSLPCKQGGTYQIIKHLFLKLPLDSDNILLIFLRSASSEYIYIPNNIQKNVLTILSNTIKIGLVHV